MNIFNYKKKEKQAHDKSERINHESANFSTPLHSENNKIYKIIFFLFCAHTLFYTSDYYYSMQFKMSTEYIKIAINAIVTRNIIKKRIKHEK